MARKPKPYTKTETSLLKAVFHGMSVVHTWLYRATRGRLGSTFPGGAPVLLLTTTGRKTGLPRTTPLLCLENGEDFVIVASQGGMESHPLWYLNLCAHPEVETQFRRTIERRVARTAGKEEKALLWPRVVGLYPPYQSYQARTQRDIPVVVLSKVANAERSPPPVS